MNSTFSKKLNCLGQAQRSFIGARPQQNVVQTQKLLLKEKKNFEVKSAGDAISGEWAVNWSLSSYDDVSEFYSDQILNETISPEYLLADVMKRDVQKVSPEDKLSDIRPIFDSFTGAPVINAEGKLVGVISKKDMEKDGDIVGDIMTKKVIAMRPTAKVIDAASLMLKHKVHRIPVVDNEKKVLGIVTRTDVFESLPNTESEVEI